MVIGRKSAYRSSFVVLAFPNALDYWNVDGRVKNGDDPCDVNFVGFCPVNADQLCTAGIDQHSG